VSEATSEKPDPKKPEKKKPRKPRRGLRIAGRVILGLIFTGMAVWILIDLDRRASEMAHEALHWSTGFSPPAVAQAPGIAIGKEFTEDFGSPSETFTVQVTSTTNVNPPEVRTFRNRNDCGDTVWPYGSGGGSMGLADAAVWIEGVDKGSSNYVTFLSVSNSGCSLWPHVSVAGVGTTMTVENYLYSPEALRVTLLDGEGETLIEQISLEGMDTYTYAARTADVTLDQPGLVKIQSVLRPWETSFVLVCEHAYCGVTDWEGKVQMMNLPHGKYTLHAWHHIAGHHSQEITVDPAIAGSTQTVTYP